MSRDCCAALSRVAIGLSAVSDYVFFLIILTYIFCKMHNFNNLASPCSWKNGLSLTGSQASWTNVKRQAQLILNNIITDCYICYLLNKTNES